MPRYYFDISDGQEHPDEIGRELEGGPILRAEALQVAVTLMKAEADEAKETMIVLSVRDEAGALALRLRLACLIE